MKQFRNFPTPHSHPQSLDSGSTPKAFMKREKELGSPAITCTDHGTLAATYQIYKLGQENGLIPILGLEAYVRPRHCPILEKLGIPKTQTIPRGNDRDKWLTNHPGGTYVDYAKYFHLTLGFLDYDAFLCGVKLLSKADDNAELYGQERKPIFDWDDVEELAGHNVTAGTSCLVGMVGRHLVIEGLPNEKKVQIAKQYFERLHQLFQGRFYAEVFPHVCSHNYVECVLLDVEGSKGRETLKFYYGKKFRTNQNEVEGITAQELAARFDPKKHLELVAVKNYRTWEPYPEKYRILSIEKKEGFIQNECTAWAPGGDVQYGVNRFIMGMAKQAGIPIVVSDDCLAEGSIIRCIEGYKQVELIKPGDIVVAHDGELSTVEATRGFFTKKECVEIDSGGVPLVLTKDHRVWAKKALRYDGGVYSLLKNTEVTPEWINAGELQKGDLVFVPKQNLFDKEESPKFDLSKYVNHKWRFKLTEDKVFVTNHTNGEEVSFKRYLVINNDVLWIMGFFVGDGNAHNNLTSFVAETETYELLRPRLISLASLLEMKFDEKHCKNHSIFRIINTCFTQFMRREFYNEHKEKRVPDWILKTGKTGVINFLSGLMYADGSSYGGGEKAEIRYSLSMTSLNVISFAREVALSLGTYCSVGCRKTTGSVLPLYTINFPPEITSILNLWTTKKERKAIRWIEEDNGYWVRIKDIKDKGAGLLVYDLQVSRSGSYSTLGFAVHNSHFAVRDDKVVQDVRLAQSGAWRFYGSYHRQSSDEAYEYFKQHHNTSGQEFEGWVDNSLAFADRFKGFEFKTAPSLPVKFYPSDTLGHTKELIQKYGRFINKPEYVSRLKTELDILHRNGKIDLLPYFFLAEEQCRLYANQGLLTGCGRGSAAGLLLSYLLGITHIDPLKYGLSLERFITLDRIRSGKTPDIDLDFPDRKFLVGSEDDPVDVVEFEAEDGTKHTVPETMKLETSQGLFTIREAMERSLDLTPWWTERNINEKDEKKP